MVNKGDLFNHNMAAFVYNVLEVTKICLKMLVKVRGDHMVKFVFSLTNNLELYVTLKKNLFFLLKDFTKLNFVKYT